MGRYISELIEKVWSVLEKGCRENEKVYVCASKSYYETSSLSIALFDIRLIEYTWLFRMMEKHFTSYMMVHDVNYFRAK